MGGFASFPSGSVPPFPFWEGSGSLEGSGLPVRELPVSPSSASPRSRLWDAPHLLVYSKKGCFCLTERMGCAVLGTINPSSNFSGFFNLCRHDSM